MLSITWFHYAAYSLILFAIYYAYVLVVYFRKELPLIRKKNKVVQHDNGIAPKTNGTVQQHLFEEETYHQNGSTPHKEELPIQQLVDELQAFIIQAGIDDMEKDDLLVSLKQLLQKYPTVKGSDFQQGINMLISTTLEEHTSIRLDAEELSRLWKS